VERSRKKSIKSYYVSGANEATENTGEIRILPKNKNLTLFQRKNWGFENHTKVAPKHSSQKAAIWAII